MLKAPLLRLPSHARGMTLIELMVGVTLIAVVLMLGMPSLSLWMGVVAQIPVMAEVGWGDE